MLIDWSWFKSKVAPRPSHYEERDSAAFRSRFLPERARQTEAVSYTHLAWRHSGSAVAAFILAFYGLLIGSKVLLAVGVGSVGASLSSRGYILLMHGLGLLLVGYGGLLLGEGSRSLYNLL